jgi:hypothetical protein
MKKSIARHECYICLRTAVLAGTNKPDKGK